MLPGEILESMKLEDESIDWVWLFRMVNVKEPWG